MFVHVLLGLVFTTVIAAVYVAVNVYVGWFVFAWRSALGYHRRLLKGR